MADHGFALLRQGIDKRLIDDVHSELLDVASTLANGRRFPSIDAAWNYFKHSDRDLGGLLYNGFKHLPSVLRLGTTPQLLELVKETAGVRQPALVDVNCRIDSCGEDQFLFGWHQDYWFSICSPQALVVWIPVVDIDSGTGGLDLISNKDTDGRIFRTRGGDTYHSYANAVILDEAIPDDRVLSVEDMSGNGDLLMFRFNLMHRSKAVISPTRSRFTIQLRFTDFTDPEFINHRFKPGVINSTKIDYLQRGTEK